MCLCVSICHIWLRVSSNQSLSLASLEILSAARMQQPLTIKYIDPFLGLTS